ncbi:MAG: hypothetical protein ACWA5Q_09275 [bacterium]
MDIINFRRHFSQNTLLRMVIVAAAIAAVGIWKKDLIMTIYFKDQLTQLGLVINGAIIALFAVGLLKMILIFLSYTREEAAIGRFIKNADNKKQTEPLKGVSKNSIISRRYRTMAHLHESNTPISQGALASTLMASESTRTSLPKFINNTLILTGVFGTIVSLSMALLGASDMLGSVVNTDGMGMVVHGMSTALSTTITAIVCYLYFGYFYLKLTDAQTNLVSAVEQVTTAHLLPKYQVQTDSVLYEFTGLIRSLQTLVQAMETSQQNMGEVEIHLQKTLDEYHEKVESLGLDMNTIIQILRQGFRLKAE